MATGSILVVDDDDTILDIVVDYLNAEGYQTLAAASGEEALPHLDRRDLDLLITDFKMPGMNGLELARKALMADSDRPVILMTAFADVDNARESVSIGVYDFILKPFDLADFGNVIRHAVSHRRLLMQNQEYQRNLERMVEDRTRELQEALRGLQEASDKLEGKVKELAGRDRINQLLLTVHTLEETLSAVLEAVQDALGVERAVIFLPDASGQRLEPVAGAGVLSQGDLASSEALRRLSDPWVEEVGADAARAFREGRVISEEGPSGRCRAVVPMLRMGEGVGVVAVQNPFSGRPLAEEDVEKLMGLTALAAVAVSDAWLYGDNEQWRTMMKNVGNLLSGSDVELKTDPLLAKAHDRPET